jgi:acyl carrier protein
MDNRERLLRVIESVLGCDAQSVSDADGPRTVAGWDSVAHVHLILSVEQEFGVHFESSEIPSLLTVGAILARLSTPHER